MANALKFLKDIAPALFVVFGAIEGFFGAFDKATYFTALACAHLLMEMKCNG